jgi:hypothetical protein
MIVSASTSTYGPVMWLNARPTEPLPSWLANDASSLPQSAPVTSVRMTASMRKASSRRQCAASVMLVSAETVTRGGASTVTARSCPARRDDDQ